MCDDWFLIIDACSMVHVAWLKAHSSCPRDQPLPRGQGSQRPRPRPDAAHLGPAAGPNPLGMSHEPWSIEHASSINAVSWLVYVLAVSRIGRQISGLRRGSPKAALFQCSSLKGHIWWFRGRDENTRTEFSIEMGLAKKRSTYMGCNMASKSFSHFPIQKHLWIPAPTSHTHIHTTTPSYHTVLYRTCTYLPTRTCNQTCERTRPHTHSAQYVKDNKSRK